MAAFTLTITADSMDELIELLAQQMVALAPQVQDLEEPSVSSNGQHLSAVPDDPEPSLLEGLPSGVADELADIFASESAPGDTVTQTKLLEPELAELMTKLTVKDLRAIMADNGLAIDDDTGKKLPKAELVSAVVSHARSAMASGGSLSLALSDLSAKGRDLVTAAIPVIGLEGSTEDETSADDDDDWGAPGDDDDVDDDWGSGWKDGDD